MAEAHDVVIAFRAAAVNRFELILRGGPVKMPGFSLPNVPGMDVSGEVIDAASAPSESTSVRGWSCAPTRTAGIADHAPPGPRRLPQRQVPRRDRAR